MCDGHRHQALTAMAWLAAGRRHLTKTSALMPASHLHAPAHARTQPTLCTPSTGTLPASWGNLQLLERLDLSNTRWQPLPAPGQWPLSWANMSSLHYLDLSASNYTTPIIGASRHWSSHVLLVDTCSW